MSRCAHICMMAEYNQWMNAKLYAAAAGLPPEELRRELSERYDQLEIMLAQKRAEAEERARIRRMQAQAASD